MIKRIRLNHGYVNLIQIKMYYPRLRYLEIQIWKKNFVKSGRSSVVLCTHYPPYNSTDPDHWFCMAGNGCIARHQLVECPAASRSNWEIQSYFSQGLTISDMAEQISRFRSEISEIRSSQPPRRWRDRIKDGFKWVDRPREINGDSAK